MKYYKIIKDNTFIGVVTSDNFVRYQQKHGVFISTTERRGEFIEYNNKLYRGTWMTPSSSNTEGLYEIADIIEITEEKYNEFKTAIENNATIFDNEEQAPKITPIDPIEQLSFEFILNNKLEELSTNCRLTIENGFDLELRGEMRHFSLTTQDQLNLMNLNMLAQTQHLIPYHADGEACEFYTPNEINEIIAAANTFKNYQIAYNNSLKAYVNALESVEEISAITYGTPIPEEYKTDVLKVLE